MSTRRYALFTDVCILKRNGHYLVCSVNKDVKIFWLNTTNYSTAKRRLDNLRYNLKMYGPQYLEYYDYKVVV